MLFKMYNGDLVWDTFNILRVRTAKQDWTTDDCYLQEVKMGYKNCSYLIGILMERRVELGVQLAEE